MTLAIMAAGLGSRYGGGIKQLARVGANGEILMDFSIHDALKAGFDKIVFIIRRDLEEDFREIIGKRIEEKCNVEYVYQELDALPEGFTCPQDRTKPWGTGHAILCCKDVIKEPFAVINADDFYGYSGFKAIYDYMNEKPDSDDVERICLAGYVLENTLSENGGVSRGICKASTDGYLLTVDETKNIHRENGIICADGHDFIAPDTTVSMNMWGLNSSFIDKLEQGFIDFLKAIPEGDTKSEFFLPLFISELIEKGKARVKVLNTNETWFGITFKEDLPLVQSEINKLIEKGVYPEKL